MRILLIEFIANFDFHLSTLINFDFESINFTVKTKHIFERRESLKPSIHNAKADRKPKLLSFFAFFPVKFPHFSELKFSSNFFFLFRSSYSFFCTVHIQNMYFRKRVIPNARVCIRYLRPQIPILLFQNIRLMTCRNRRSEKRSKTIHRFHFVMTQCFLIFVLISASLTFCSNIVAWA